MWMMLADVAVLGDPREPATWMVLSGIAVAGTFILAGVFLTWRLLRKRSDEKK